MGFLIPYDAMVDLENPDSRSGYLQTCIPMNSLWSYLEGSAAKHRLLIVDACYGGLLAKMRALSRTTDDKESEEFSPKVLSLIDQLSSPALSPFPMAVKDVWQATLPNPMVEDSTCEMSAYSDGYLKYRGLNCVKMGQTAQVPTGSEGKFVQFAIVFLLNPKTGRQEQVIAKAFKVPSTSNGVKFDVNISARIQYHP